MKPHAAARENRDRMLRIVLPVVVLALGLGVGSGGAASTIFRPTCCPRRF